MSAMRKKRGWVYRGVLASISLLVILFGLLWASSYLVRYWAAIELSAHSGLGASINIGSLELYCVNDPILIENSFGFEYHGWGFSVDRLWLMYWDKQGYGTFIMVPMWVPFLLLAVWPTLAAVQSVRNRPLAGCCPACNYDLRGSKQSANCPECGEVI